MAARTYTHSKEMGRAVWKWAFTWIFVLITTLSPGSHVFCTTKNYRHDIVFWTSRIQLVVEQIYKTRRNHAKPQVHVFHI